MASSSLGYRIVDEPRPSTLSRLTVAPFWPFLAVMLFGVIGFFWFALNAVAVGSATRFRQIVMIAVIVLVYWMLLILNVSFSEPLAGSALPPYLFLIPLLWRLGAGYVLFAKQSLDVELFEHFDAGKVANGAIGLAIVFGCIMLIRQVGPSLPLLFYLTV